MSLPDDQLCIDLHDVKKSYGRKVHALRGISMQVRRGEVFGLLGPNGAGKSTLVKIMMTVVRANTVRGTMLGQPIGHKPTLGHVGYLPEHHRMPKYLTGAQVLDFYGALGKVDRRTRRRRAGELLDTVGMTDWAKKKISTYSKGMQQRIGLAQALINDPQLVVLDEPTDGVDPVGRRDIRDVLIALRDQGRTVFLNSHLLSELEMVCSRVAILVQGVVSQQGTLEELTRASRRYEVLIEGEPPAWTHEESNITAHKANGDRTRLTWKHDTAESVQPLIDRLRAESRVIVAVEPKRESLEDLFMRSVTDESGAVLKPGAAQEQREASS